LIWDLKVTTLDAQTCQFTNLVISHPTRAFLDMLDASGQTFEEAARWRP
jgi:hypothetical protein